ncbi:MAG: hypothetical protein C0469_15345 [Cyanobacteria bacterium DS2.3.42]|nr:hypothetical protein [Cyanobacteria bacterium DS2.3.42]
MKDEKKKTPSEWTVMIGKNPKKFSSFEEALLFADTSEIKGTRAVDFTNLRIIVIPSIDRAKRDLAS